MAVPASEIIAPVRRISFYVLVAKRRVPGVIEATVDLGVDQLSGQARIVCTKRPSWAQETDAVQVWVIINGYPALLFKGEVKKFNWTYFPGRCTIEAATPLHVLQNKWAGEELQWTAVDPVDVVLGICSAAGLQVQSIYSDKIVADFVPITLKPGDSSTQLINSMLEIAGYALFDGPDGLTRCLPFDGQPGPTAAWTAKKDVDILDISRERESNGIFNHIIVDGLAVFDVPIHAEQSAPNEYLRKYDGSYLYIADTFQSDAIQTQELAQTVANERLARLNRRPEKASGTVRGNPRLTPAITFGIEHDRIETGNGVRTFLSHVTHNLKSNGGYTTSFRTTGGTFSDYNAQAPYAAFTVESFFENRMVDDEAEAIIVVVCDGSTSWAPTGDVTRWVWSSSSGATQDSADPRFSFIVAATVTSVTVTLTVYNQDDMASAPLVQVVPLGAGETLYEELYYVCADVFACTRDGEQTFRYQYPESGRTYTCMAQFASADGQFAGDSAGHVWFTPDRCETLLDRGAPAGASACTALWLHEQIPGLVYAAFYNHQVWISADLGETWTLAGTIPGAASAVKVIQSSPEQSTMLTAAAGGSFYSSTDGGAEWTEELSGDVAWWSVNGYGRVLAGFLNTEEPAKYVGGDVISFPVLTPPVTHIRGVTLGWRRPYALLIDDQARSFRTDDQFLIATQTGDLSTGGNHLIRSGNADGVAYVAGDDGIEKTVRDGDDWFRMISTPSAVIQVAYGLATNNQPLVTGGVLLRTASALWRWSEAGGLSNITSNLPVGINGWSPDLVAVDPTNSNRIAVATTKAWSTVGGSNAPSIYLVGSDSVSSTAILWITDTGGASWRPAPWSGLNASAASGGEGTGENAGYGMGYRFFGSAGGYRHVANHQLRAMAFSREQPGLLIVSSKYEFDDTSDGGDFDFVLAGPVFGTGAAVTETTYPRQSAGFYGRLWDVACADGVPATTSVMFATSDGVRHVANAANFASWTNAGSGEQSGGKFVAFARGSNLQVISGSQVRLRQTPTGSATLLDLDQDGYAPTWRGSNIWYTTAGGVSTYNTATSTSTERYDGDAFGTVALHATRDGLTIFAASFSESPGRLIVSSDGGTTWRQISASGATWLQLYAL